MSPLEQAKKRHEETSCLINQASNSPGKFCAVYLVRDHLNLIQPELKVVVSDRPLVDDMDTKLKACSLTDLYFYSVEQVATGESAVVREWIEANNINNFEFDFQRNVDEAKSFFSQYFDAKKSGVPAAIKRQVDKFDEWKQIYLKPHHTDPITGMNPTFPDVTPEALIDRLVELNHSPNPPKPPNSRKPENNSETSNVVSFFKRTG